MSKQLFLTLKVFSATGGIEKVCRVAGKALYEMRFSCHVQTQIMSMHDLQSDADDNPYFPSEIFEGFAANKLAFVKKAVQKGMNCDRVILSHVNLLLVAWLIKKKSPKTRIYLFAHGIEIWKPVRGLRKKMLACVNYFLCVSHYTQSMVEKIQGVTASRCRVLNNCIDPYLPLPLHRQKEISLMVQHHLAPDTLLLFTLTRLASKDRYKGYDKVFEAVALLKDQYPQLRYLVGGSYDAIEKEFVDAAIRRLQLQDTVIIAGYLPEEDLASYFAMADIYVMPSRKEGFGIVFVEAMYYGLPVIAGNADGSVDALLNGQLGLLVNPESIPEIKNAIEKMLKNITAFQPDHELLLEHFGYENYKLQLEQLLQCSNSDTSIPSGDMLMARGLA